MSHPRRPNNREAQLDLTTLKFVLDIGKRVASIIVEGERLEIPTEPEFVDQYPEQKNGTDAGPLS